MAYTANKTVKTVVLIYIWITKGLYGVIGGPTMIDLMLTLNLRLEEVARAISGAGMGTLPAVVISAFMTDKFDKWKDLVMAAFQTIAAIGVFLIPFVNEANALWAVFFIVGISTTVLNFVGQRLLLDIWEEKSPSPMHAMHMGFGIGALLSPVVANPFLAVTSKTTPDRNTSTHNSNDSQVDLDQPSPGTIHVIQPSRVEYAFIIIAVVTLIGAAPFWYYQARKCIKGGSDVIVNAEGHRHKSNRTFKEIVNPAAYAEGSMVAGIGILLLLLCIYINAVGGEHSFGNFVRTYSVDVLNFDKDNASYVNLVYWLCHTLGRFFSFVVARYVPIRYLLFVEVLVNLISTTLVHTLASRSKLSLWIFSALQGFVVSPIYGSGVTFTNTQVEMRGIMLMSSEIGSGLGVAFYVWLTGYMYDAYGPRALLIAVQVSGITIFVFTTILLVIGHIRGNRFDRMITDEQTQTRDKDIRLDAIPTEDDQQNFLQHGGK